MMHGTYSVTLLNFQLGALITKFQTVTHGINYFLSYKKFSNNDFYLSLEERNKQKNVCRVY